MARRDIPLVRPFSEDPAIVGPYSTWIAEEGDRERAERGRGEAQFAHENGCSMIALRKIAAEHNVAMAPLVAAFYVGRFSQMLEADQ